MEDPSAGPPRFKVPAWAIPTLIAAVTAAIPFVIMCTDKRFGFSVPVGFAACLVSAFAILHAVGSFSPRGQAAAATTTLRALAPRLAVFGGAVVLHLAALAVAVAGTYPSPIFTAAMLVPLTFLFVVVAAFQLGRALGVFRSDPDRPYVRRYGFWLIVANVVLYLPLLGSYSLSDPWETHYGEVAREMLARDDWISTWWAQDGWFWSKPVLDFWIQALSFSLLGVRYMPDEMLQNAARGRFPEPEWAARMPVFVMTLIAAYAFYRCVARVFGQRAGFIAGFVLTTMPYWYLIAHQTMTDMPYVSALTAAMSLLVLGFLTDPDERVAEYEVTARGRAFRFSALHLGLVAVIVSALPQALYLFSRNVTLHLRRDLFGFQPHVDRFFSGSGGGNCGLPGNQGCQAEHPVYTQLFAVPQSKILVLVAPLLNRVSHFVVTPGFLGLVWTIVAAAFVWFERHEQRRQRIYFIGAWYFLAVSMLGKGAPGLVLPIVSALAFVGVTRRWRDLERLEIVSLVLIVACVGLPWYVQMYIRHGPPFIDRLIMHDMYKRAFVHVHDTNTGDDVSFRYYVWQLGYGLFPWTGLAATGLLWWLRRADRTKDGRGDLSAFMIVWFLSAFGMFTITLTKFHHYILPLVPPTAALTGVFVDSALGNGSPARRGKLGAYLGATTAGVGLVLYGVERFFPRRLSGEALGAAHPWKGWAWLSILAGLGAIAVAIRRFGSYGTGVAAPDAAPNTDYDRAVFAVAGFASAVVLAVVGRDLFASGAGFQEGSQRLMHLFTYNYSRPWPDSLNYQGPLVAFTVGGAALSIGLMSARWRAQAATLFCVAAGLWTAWGLDVYLYKCSPHWGQRETILAYYKDRTDPNQPFVAYQMNWKGENFYTSNKVPAFVSSGEPFKRWVEDQKNHGVKRVYFTSEQGRLGALKRELGDPPKFTKLTDEKLNNKFFVARVDF
jgi:4-amino-4-deoxy-L-arabinose transferase-like glycosyltransferase